MGRGKSGLANSGGGGGKSNTDADLISGKPGDYTLYRAGDISRSGFVFLTTDKSVANLYSHNDDNTIRPVKEYKVVIKNPLVIDGEGMDSVALRKAWIALHPGKTIVDYRKEIVKSGGMTAAKWKKADKQNAAALAGSSYDAVVYKNGNQIKEVWIHSNRRNDFRLQ